MQKAKGTYYITRWKKKIFQIWISPGKVIYFLAKVIFIAFVGVILKLWRASLAAPAWTSVSNSTNAMSCRPGTKRTSLNPGNLKKARSIWYSWDLLCVLLNNNKKALHFLPYLYSSGTKQSIFMLFFLLNC